MPKLVLAMLIASILTACATQPPTLYHWGSYESLINDMYVNPGNADAPTQIAKLTEDLDQAHNLGKSAPPGVYAHLGMLYASIGNDEQSKLSFEKETLLYPESAHLIEGMMARADKMNTDVTETPGKSSVKTGVESPSVKEPKSTEQKK